MIEATSTAHRCRWTNRPQAENMAHLLRGGPGRRPPPFSSNRMPRSVARLTWTSVEGRYRAAVGKRPPWLVESVSFSCRPATGLRADRDVAADRRELDGAVGLLAEGPDGAMAAVEDRPDRVDRHGAAVCGGGEAGAGVGRQPEADVATVRPQVEAPPAHLAGEPDVPAQAPGPKRMAGSHA